MPAAAGGGSRPGAHARATATRALKPRDRDWALLDDFESPKAPTRRLAQRRHLGLSQLRGILAGVGHRDHRPLELGAQRRPARFPAHRPAAIASELLQPRSSLRPTINSGSDPFDGTVQVLGGFYRTARRRRRWAS